MPVRSIDLGSWEIVGRTVSTPISRQETEQLTGLVKPASCREGLGRRTNQWQVKRCVSAFHGASSCFFFAMNSSSVMIPLSRREASFSK